MVSDGDSDGIGHRKMEIANREPKLFGLFKIQINLVQKIAKPMVKSLAQSNQLFKCYRVSWALSSPHIGTCTLLTYFSLTLANMCQDWGPHFKCLQLLTIQYSRPRLRMHRFKIYVKGQM